MMQVGIERYRQTSKVGRPDQNKDAREALILEHAPLVKYIAEGLAVKLPSSITREELISSGIVGLIDALNNFDPNKGIKFRTYAAYRIRGTILDELRKLDWIPRSVRKDIQWIDDATMALRSRTGSEPDDSEIAEEMGIDLERYYKIISKARGGGLLSLEELSRDDATPFVARLASPVPSPLDAVKREELKGVLAEAVSNLSEKEQLVVSLRYYDEMTLKEIAEVLGLTESRISQIHSKALTRLRPKLKTYNEE